MTKRGLKVISESKDFKNNHTATAQRLKWGQMCQRAATKTDEWEKPSLSSTPPMFSSCCSSKL